MSHDELLTSGSGGNGNKAGSVTSSSTNKKRQPNYNLMVANPMTQFGSHSGESTKGGVEHHQIHHHHQHLNVA